MKYLKSLFLLFTILLSSCKKTESALPVVQTFPVSVIDANTAISGGLITGENIKDKGVCWSTDPNPDIKDDKTSDGTGPEHFQSDIMGLEPATVYYLRAYATNKLGTGYGAQITFTTSNFGFGQMTDIDGYRYKTIQIGSQTWMAENLKVTRYRNGAAITLVSNYSQWGQATSGAMCYYNDENINGYEFGALYNFQALTDSRNICPQGWHIPTQFEWNQLIANLGGTTQAAYKMRLTQSDYWNGYSSDNSSGFSAIPSGYRNTSYFYGLRTGAYYWSSPSSTVTTTRYYYIDNSNINNDQDGYGLGLSIRCVKD